MTIRRESSSERSRADSGQGEQPTHWTFYTVDRRADFRGRVGPAYWQPNIDMYETPDAVVVLVELAGIHGDSVHIGVEGKSLRLTGTRIPRFSSSYRQFHQLEIPQGKFERVIELPRAVNVEASRAEYLDGFLEIVLPLARPVRVQVAPGKREGA